MDILLLVSFALISVCLFFLVVKHFEYREISRRVDRLDRQQKRLQYDLDRSHDILIRIAESNVKVAQAIDDIIQNRNKV